MQKSNGETGITEAALHDAPDPTRDLNTLYKTGGISFIISGILFLIVGLLSLVTGPPPSTGAEVQTWVKSGLLPLELIDEALFFAALFLIPAVIALYYSLVGIARTRAAVGCGIIAVVIPIIFVLNIFHGRLVYPVYDMDVNTPAIAELVVTVYYGGFHAVYLLLGVATIVVSLAMKRGIYGRYIAYLGIATGVSLFIGSDPWIIGPVTGLICQVLFTAWFLAVGWRLFRSHRVTMVNPKELLQHGNRMVVK